MDYYAPDGSIIALEEWAELFEKRQEDMALDSWWRRVSYVGEVCVSTVWLGTDHGLGFGDAPLFWETMLFRDEHGEEQWRYSSREEALDHHEEIVRSLRAAEGDAPP